MDSVIILKVEDDITAISSVVYPKKKFGDVIYDDANMIVKNLDDMSLISIKINLKKFDLF